MSSDETQHYIYYETYSRSAIVALSASPPGVNELCVCVCVCVCNGDFERNTQAESYILLPNPNPINEFHALFLFDFSCYLADN